MENKKYLLQKNITGNRFVCGLKNLKNKISQMEAEKITKMFNNLDKNISNLSKKDIDVIYKQSLPKIIKCRKNIINNKDLNINNEITNIDLDNKVVQVKFNESLKKTVNKIAKVLNHPVTKTVVSIAIAIMWILLYREYSTATVACALTKDNISEKIDLAFFCVRMITSVVAFIWMCLELSNNVVRGDIRSIWYTVTKYIVVITVVVGYKSIFNLIDNFFN